VLRDVAPTVDFGVYAPQAPTKFDSSRFIRTESGDKRMKLLDGWTEGVVKVYDVHVAGIAESELFGMAKNINAIDPCELTHAGVLLKRSGFGAPVDGQATNGYPRITDYGGAIPAN